MSAYEHYESELNNSIYEKEIRFSDHTNTSRYYDKPDWNFSLDFD